MENVKNIKKVETKMETKKVETVSKEMAPTNANIFEVELIKGHKNRKAVVTATMLYLKNRGVTENIRGKKIDEQHLLQQLGATLYDVVHGNYRWKNYTIVETETEIKIVPKKAL
jgi:hypothetical protein